MGKVLETSIRANLGCQQSKRNRSAASKTTHDAQELFDEIVTEESRFTLAAAAIEDHASHNTRENPALSDGVPFAPPTGFEPVTPRLTVECSAVELWGKATKEYYSRPLSEMSNR